MPAEDWGQGSPVWRHKGGRTWHYLPALPGALSMYLSPQVVRETGSARMEGVRESVVRLQPGGWWSLSLFVCLFVGNTQGKKPAPVEGPPICLPGVGTQSHHVLTQTYAHPRNSFLVRFLMPVLKPEFCVHLFGCQIFMCYALPLVFPLIPGISGLQVTWLVGKYLLVAPE